MANVKTNVVFSVPNLEIETAGIQKKEEEREGGGQERNKDRKARKEEKERKEKKKEKKRKGGNKPCLQVRTNYNHHQQFTLPPNIYRLIIFFH